MLYEVITELIDSVNRASKLIKDKNTELQINTLRDNIQNKKNSYNFV